MAWIWLPPLVHGHCSPTTHTHTCVQQVGQECRVLSQPHTQREQPMPGQPPIQSSHTQLYPQRRQCKMTTPLTPDIALRPPSCSWQLPLLLHLGLPYVHACLFRRIPAVILNLLIVTRNIHEGGSMCPLRDSTLL